MKVLSREEIIPQFGELASGVESTIYGTYYHRHLAIHISSQTRKRGALETLLYLNKERDPKKRLRAAIHSIAFVHEYRHFHDCFGTVAGISLFLNHIARLRSFVNICSQLSNDGLTWVLPINDWVTSKSCPTYIRRFVVDLLVDQHRQMIFEGSFGVKPRPGGDTRVWERFSVPHTVGFEFDAFPLQVGYLTEQQQTLAPHTHWIPLGFNVLIEGNAQAIQMRCLEATYPQDINNAFLAAQTARRFELPMDEEIDAAALGKSLVQPYRITDLLISKFLNSKYGDKAKFPRERILELTDRALMASILPEFPSKKARSAGAAFLSIMEKANWPGRRGEPITYSPYDKDELISFRKEMISCPLPEKVEDSISFYSVLNYIEYYVRHRIIAPMLKLRIDFGNKIFYDPDCYMENFTKFPTAPMIIEDGNFYPAADLDRNFPKRWSQYMMLSSVAESIWQRRSIIPCPRAYPEMSMGLTNFEFCADREDTIETMGCRKMIATRRCLTWDNKRKRPLPDCHFGLITKGLRLAPWTS